MDETGRQTVEADDGSFKSGVLHSGSRLEHKFDKHPPTHASYCGFHCARGGKGMSGVVKVSRQTTPATSAAQDSR